MWICRYYVLAICRENRNIKDWLMTLLNFLFPFHKDQRAKKRNHKNMISRRVSNKCISKKKRRNRNEKKNAAADNEGNEGEGLDPEMAKLTGREISVIIF